MRLVTVGIYNGVITKHHPTNACISESIPITCNYVVAACDAGKGLYCVVDLPAPHLNTMMYIAHGTTTIVDVHTFASGEVPCSVVFNDTLRLLVVGTNRGISIMQ